VKNNKEKNKKYVNTTIFNHMKYRFADLLLRQSLGDDAQLARLDEAPELSLRLNHPTKEEVEALRASAIPTTRNRMQAVMHQVLLQTGWPRISKAKRLQ